MDWIINEHSLIGNSIYLQIWKMYKRKKKNFEQIFFCLFVIFIYFSTTLRTTLGDYTWCTDIYNLALVLKGKKRMKK